MPRQRKVNCYLAMPLRVAQKPFCWGENGKYFGGRQCIISSVYWWTTGDMLPNDALWGSLEAY